VEEGEIETDILGRGRKYPALKVPRHCPLVLLAEVRTFERLKVSEWTLLRAEGRQCAGALLRKFGNLILKLQGL
jgi:hypothetical protein